MSEFLDILSPSALRDLQKANQELTTMIRNVATLGVSMNNVTLPSQNDAEVRRLNAELQNQATIIANLQQQLTRLANVRQQGNQRTSEEIVNQRTLAQNADRQARATSALVGAYANLNAQHQIASRRLQDLIVRGRTAEQTQRQYNRELRNAQREFRQLDGRIQSADRAVGRFNRNVGNYPRQALGFMKDLLGAFGLAGGITLFADMAKDAFNTVKELQSLNMALLQVTGSQEQMAKSQAFLADISEKYGVEIKDLTKMFTQFYVSAKDKMAGKDIENIFESITKAGASMGLSQENMQRAFLAMNQIMAKGAVQAEELKGQLSEALPGALGIMAKSLGVTEKKLMDMMKAGEVSSDALIGFAQQLEKTYGIENVERIDNIVNAQNRLSNSWTALIATFAEGDGALSRGTKSILNGFSEDLDRLNQMMKSEAQLRKDYLDRQQQAGNEASEEQIEKMRKRGDSEIKIQTYITKAVSALQKKQTEVYLEAKKLEDEIVGNYDAESRKRNGIALAQLNNDIKKRQGMIAGLQQYLKPEKNKVDGETDKTEKDRLKREEEARRQAFENRKKQLELELQTIAETMNDETRLEVVRLEALELYRLKRNEITTLMYNEEMRLAKDNQGKQTEALLNYQKTTLDSINAWVKLLEGIQKDQIKPIEAKTVGDAGKTLADGAKLATDALEKQNDQLKITKESLEAIQKQIDDYLKSFQEGFFADAGLPTLFKVLNNEITGFGKNFAVTFTTMAEIAQEAFSFISEASNRNFQNEYDNLAKQKEISLLFAGESASAREEIERQYDQRQREIKRRQAQAEKRQALFNIAIDTAQGVVSALASTPPNVPLSIAIGVIGAIQAGVVAGQQIPQFWRGTENAPEGWAYTQERGAEIITDKNNKIKYLGDGNGAQLTYLNKGDKVKTASMTKDLLSFDQSLNNILLSNNIDGAPRIEVNNSAMSDAQVDRIVRTIEGKTEYMPIIDKDGFNDYVRKGNTVYQNKNRKVNFKGTQVG